MVFWMSWRHKLVLYPVHRVLRIWQYPFSSLSLSHCRKSKNYNRPSLRRNSLFQRLWPCSEALRCSVCPFPQSRSLCQSVIPSTLCILRVRAKPLSDTYARVWWTPVCYSIVCTVRLFFLQFLRLSLSHTLLFSNLQIKTSTTTPVFCATYFPNGCELMDDFSPPSMFQLPCCFSFRFSFQFCVVLSGNALFSSVASPSSSSLKKPFPSPFFALIFSLLPPAFSASYVFLTKVCTSKSCIIT